MGDGRGARGDGRGKEDAEGREGRDKKRVTDRERRVMGEGKEDGGDGKAGIWCDKKRKRY